MSDLTGKVAVLTACGAGIGRAVALALGRRGAKIVASDILLGAAEAVTAEIVAAGGEASALRCDVEREEDVAALVREAVSRYGRLDMLHNNAAYQGSDLMEKDADIVSMEAEFWDKTMAVNLRGVMFGCKYAIPEMLRSGGGAIVNTASINGLGGFLSMPAYGVSKAAVTMLTRNVAARYGREGIRCNAIAPSLVMTPSAERFLPDEIVQLHRDVALVPRLCSPEGVAAVVAFLLSDDSGFVNGHTLPVDGGAMSQLAINSQFRRYLAGDDDNGTHAAAAE